MPELRGFNRAALIIHHWLWQAADWVFPPACIGCGKPGERWCLDCQDTIERVGNKICLKCGKRLKKGKTCRECLAHKPAYSALRSYGLYRDPLRRAILRVKYQRDLGLGEVLARLLKQLVAESSCEAELIIPVPLSQKKLDERGYNQVDLFARPLAWSLGLPFHSRALERVHEDTSQVKLTADERRRNVIQAFRLNAMTSINGKRVLLVDDVATTGSTAEACSEVLLQGGAASVFVITLARSLLRKTDQEVI
jgi:competence protein ComFC